MKTKEELLLIEIKRLNDILDLCEEALRDCDVPGTTYSNYLWKKRDIELDLTYFEDKT